MKRNPYPIKFAPLDFRRGVFLSARLKSQILLHVLLMKGGKAHLNKVIQTMANNRLPERFAVYELNCHPNGEDKNEYQIVICKRVKGNPTSR